MNESKQEKLNRDTTFLSHLTERLDTIQGPGSGQKALDQLRESNGHELSVSSRVLMLKSKINQALIQLGEQSLKGGASSAPVAPTTASNPTPAILTTPAAPNASKPAPATPTYVSTKPAPQAPTAQAVNLKAIRGIASELFGSLVPAETGDAKSDAEALRGLLSQFNLSIPGFVNSAAAPGGFQAALADRRQERIDSWHAAVTAAEPGILEQAARITNPIERTAFIRSNEQSIRVAIAASEHDTANASKPPQHTTAENSLLARYQAITDPAERTKFITENETAIASLLQSLK